MRILFVEYPKCSTCRKAKGWLEAQGVAFDGRHIVEQPPTVEELVYRALELKDRLPGMSEDEQLALLASNGMLVKRPLAVGEDFVLVGFKQNEWEARCKGE